MRSTSLKTINRTSLKTIKKFTQNCERFHPKLPKGFNSGPSKGTRFKHVKGPLLKTQKIFHSKPLKKISNIQSSLKLIEDTRLKTLERAPFTSTESFLLIDLTLTHLRTLKIFGSNKFLMKKFKLFIISL